MGDNAMSSCKLKGKNPVITN